MYRKQSKENEVTRFWSKVQILSADECWTYIGAIGSWGYGMFCIDGKNTHASRAAWILIYGKIEGNKVVCHKCDNPPCCNPGHLFLGTTADNIADMMAKGRHRVLRGQDDPKSKLTDEQVREIRRLYVPRKFPQYKLAEMFGVSRSAIQSIICGYNWTHLK